MTVNIAGTDWPTFKLESLALGLLLFLMSLSVVSFGTSVLVGAGITVAAWLALPRVGSDQEPNGNTPGIR